jgi:DNA-binding transcriptional MocR family regulator
MRAIRNASDLAQQLERRIVGGALPPGDRLLPVRALADELGLAPNTVAAAYRLLRQRGLTIGRGRAGTFVAPRPPLAGVVDDRVPEHLVDCSSGHPDHALLPDISATLDGLTYEPATYSTSPVDPELADHFSAAFAADGIDATSLAVVGGALDGLERVLGARLRPGDRVAVEDPAYVAVLDLLAAMHLEPLPVAVDDAGPLPDALDAVLAAGCRAAILTPRAQNPTGAAIDEARAAELRGVVDAHPAVVVVEDDHAGPVAGVGHAPIVQGREAWAVIRSVSKSLGPDLRLAVVAGDATTISRVGGRQAVGTGWVSHLLQRTVVRMLATESQTLATAATTYRHRRKRFLSLLSERGITATGRSGLNVWVPVDDEGVVVAAMQQRGFAIRSGARFRIEAPPAVRITVASCSDDVLERAAGALADVVTPGARRRSA